MDRVVRRQARYARAPRRSYHPWKKPFVNLIFCCYSSEAKFRSLDTDEIRLEVRRACRPRKKIVSASQALDCRFRSLHLIFIDLTISPISQRVREQPDALGVGPLDH